MKIKFLFSAAVLFLLFSPDSHAQAWKWAKTLGMPNTASSVKSLRPYTGTSVLLSGSFTAPMLAFGTYTLANAGQEDGFLAICDEAGNYTWATSFGGSERDYVVDAAAGENGDFVVVGNFNSIFMSGGDGVFFNSGETDAFVLKYKADKTLAWAAKIGTADIDEVRAVAMDADGNTYVSGQVNDKFTLSPLYLFLRKYNTMGNLAWEKKGTLQGGGILQAGALAIDAEQHIYLSGSLSGTADFEGASLSSSEWGFSAFLLKYDASGPLLDTASFPDLNKFNGIQFRDNHLYACAEKMNYGIGWGWPLSDSKIHVLQLDTDLQTVWEKSLGGEEPSQSLDIAKSISVDTAGNAYVTGYFFSDTLEFAGQALPNLFHVNYYYPQVFVLKYDASGEEIWGKSYGGLHADEGAGIHAFGDDQFYLAGNFESDPLDLGAFDLHNLSTLDSMYVHLRPARYVRKTMGFLAVYDETSSSVHPEPAFEQVALFPNPASDYLTLRLKTPAQSPLFLQITSSDGRLLCQSEHSGASAEIRQDLSGLAPGFYFLTLRSERGSYSARFVK